MIYFIIHLINRGNMLTYNEAIIVGTELYPLS